MTRFEEQDLTGARFRKVRLTGARFTRFRCLRVILDEECQHHRFAVRDLDAIAAG